MNFESVIETWRCLFLLIPARFINTNSMVQWSKPRFPTCIMLVCPASFPDIHHIHISCCAFRPRRDSCRYTPNGKFARGPIGEATHVWVTREIRVLWKAIILRIYISEHVRFSKSLNITPSLTSSISKEMWFGCDLKTYSRLRSVARAFLRTSWV